MSDPYKGMSEMRLFHISSEEIKDIIHELVSSRSILRTALTEVRDGTGRQVIKDQMDRITKQINKLKERLNG